MERVRDELAGKLRERRFGPRAAIFIALVGAAAIGVALLAHRASNRAREAELATKRASRDAHAARARTLARAPDGPRRAIDEALAALQLDHELREPPSADRNAIIGAAHAARRHGEHVVIESDRPMRAAAFKADGAELALVGDEPMLRVVDMTTDEMVTSPLSEGALAVGWRTGTEVVVVTTRAIEIRSDHGRRLVSRELRRDDGGVTRADAERALAAETKPAPNPEGPELILPSQHEVQARDRTTGKTRWTFDARAPIAAVDAQPRRALVASGHMLHAIFDDGEAKTLLEAPFAIRYIATSSHEIALAGDDGRIRVYGSATGERLRDLDGHHGDITALAWSPRDAHRLVSTSSDHTATIWKLGGLSALVRLLPFFADAISPPAFTSAGEIALVRERSIATLDGANGAPLRHFEASTPIARGRVHADRVLAVSRTGAIVSWDTTTRKLVAERDGLATDESGVALASRAPVALACGAADCTVVDGDAKPILKLAPPRGIRGKAIAPDGKHVAIAGEDGSWTIWDVRNEVRSGTVASDAPTPHAVFAGSALVVAGASTVSLQGPTGKQVPKLAGALSDVSEEGGVVRTLENGTARFYVGNGYLRGTIDVGTKLHALSPNGDLDAIFGAGEPTVSVRATRGGGEITRLVGHEKGVTAAAWSGDGRFLATTGEDRTLRLFEIDGASQDVCAIEIEETPAEIQLSRDARRILTTDRDRRTVRLYDVSLDGAIALACRIAKGSPVCR